MFPEYRDLISKLKAENGHFERLFTKHNELDQQIKNMESHIVSATTEKIEALKKQKLAIKDDIYQILRNAASSNSSQ